MARGKPGVWSSVLGLPFILCGGYLYFFASGYPPELGVPFTLFGAFIIGIGLYIHFIAAPDSPTMRNGEEIIATRHPTQRVAAAKIVTSIPFLLATIYLFFFTFQPYVYPTVTLLAGLYFFSTGLYTYWTNTLTTYYVTDNRVIKVYRFLALNQQELPLEKVRGIQENKSATEALVGLGNVRVASGGGHSLEIVMRNMERSSEFADDLRNLI